LIAKAADIAAAAGVVVLRLYVAGRGPHSTEARRNIDAFLAEHSHHRVTLEVVDVLAEPARGLRDSVLVTPTLIRCHPGPEVRVVGNLRGRASLLASLIDGSSGDE
jgi:circadian clock protein KaiB